MKSSLVTRALALSVLVQLPVSAAVVTLTADNALNATSFDTSLSWSNAQAPSGTNDYFTNDFLFRTPATTTAAYTFAGNSLTVDGVGNTISTTTVTGTDLNDALIFKGTLAGTTTFTINNLSVNGAAFRNGSGDTNIFRVTGNSFAVGSNGMAVHAQGPMYIDSPLSGSGRIVVYDNGSNAAGRVLHLTSASNTYTGSIALVTVNRSRLALDAGSLFNFVISGTNVSNTISGAGHAAFDGTFSIDASGADLTVGNTWNLTSVTNRSFGGTFAITGYTNMGGGIWSNGAFEFNTATGNLVLASIPEPSTFAALAGLAVLGVVGARRRRR